MRLSLNYLITLALLFILSGCSDSKKEAEKTQEPKTSIFDYIHQDETPTVTITGDLSHITEEGPLTEEGKEQYHPANITIETAAGRQEMPLRIAKRGITRKRICDFPPLKLKFYADTLLSKGFSKFNTYKLVTHCIEAQEELVIAEYLAYKMYNHLTQNSFRVQLVNMIYDDSSQRVGEEIMPVKRFGFIIEEDQELAHRRKAKLYEEKVTAIDRQQYAEMVVYQYMIGNTDWNLGGGHNIKWIKQDEIPSPTPIPYDFDFCGLVNAPHAAPHPQIPISSVRERFLQWRGKTKDELHEICKDFKTKKSELLAIIENERHLSEEKKIEMKAYLTSFYDIIENGEI